MMSHIVKNINRSAMRRVVTTSLYPLKILPQITCPRETAHRSFCTKGSETPAKFKDGALSIAAKEQKRYDDMLKKLTDFSLKKKTLVPVWKDGEAKNPWDTKFGGKAVFVEGEEWPLCVSATCHNDHNHMKLIAQINLESIPSDYAVACFGSICGLFQLYRCSMDPVCGTAEFDGGCVTRIIPKENFEYLRFDVAPEKEGDVSVPLPPKTIQKWDEHSDYPDEAEEELQFYKKKLNVDDNDQDIWNKYYEEQPYGYGVKIGGWPHFLQSPHYPKCKTCDEKMMFAFMLDGSDSDDDITAGADEAEESEDGAAAAAAAAANAMPSLWEGGGNGYVFRCKKHPEVFATYGDQE